jgi:hypothetical protein
MLLGMIEEFSAKRRAMKLASEPVKRRLDAWARFDIRPSAAPDAMPVRMELCRNGATRVVCFHKDDVPLIRQMVGLVKTNVPRHSEEWLGFGEICEILGAKSNQIRAAMQAIAELYDAARGDSFDEREVTYGGRTLRVCRVTRHSARTFFCVHKDCLDDLVAASGAKIAPPVEKEWMPRNTVAAICGCDQRSRGFARLWSTLADAHEKGEPTILEGRAFKMENRRVGKVVLPCLARKHVEAFRAVFVSADPHMHPSSGGNEPDDDSETFTFQP